MEADHIFGFFVMAGIAAFAIYAVYRIREDLDQD